MVLGLWLAGWAVSWLQGRAVARRGQLSHHRVPCALKHKRSFVRAGRFRCKGIFSFWGWLWCAWAGLGYQWESQQCRLPKRIPPTCACKWSSSAGHHGHAGRQENLVVELAGISLRRGSFWDLHAQRSRAVLLQALLRVLPLAQLHLRQAVASRTTSIHVLPLSSLLLPFPNRCTCATAEIIGQDCGNLVAMVFIKDKLPMQLTGIGCIWLCTYQIYHCLLKNKELLLFIHLVK